MTCSSWPDTDAEVMNWFDLAKLLADDQVYDDINRAGRVSGQGLDWPVVKPCTDVPLN